MEKLIYKIGIDDTGKFLERPNRFIAKVELKDQKEVICHVHDSGRIKELKTLGIEINTWTVNKEEDIRDMIAKEIDIVIGNFPDLTKKIIDETVNK